MRKSAIAVSKIDGKSSRSCDRQQAFAQRVRHHATRTRSTIDAAAAPHPSRLLARHGQLHTTDTTISTSLDRNTQRLPNSIPTPIPLPEVSIKKRCQPHTRSSSTLQQVQLKNIGSPDMYVPLYIYDPLHPSTTFRTIREPEACPESTRTFITMWGAAQMRQLKPLDRIGRSLQDVHITSAGRKDIPKISCSVTDLLSRKTRTSALPELRNTTLHHQSTTDRAGVRRRSLWKQTIARRSSRNMTGSQPRLDITWRRCTRHVTPSTKHPRLLRAKSAESQPQTCGTKHHAVTASSDATPSPQQDPPLVGPRRSSHGVERIAEGTTSVMRPCSHDWTDGKTLIQPTNGRHHHERDVQCRCRGQQTLETTANEVHKPKGLPPS